MTTTRTRITFTACPECQIPTGVRGLARHREAAHNVAPAVKGRKVRPLDRAERAVLTEAAAGEISAARLAYRTTITKLTRAGYLAADLTITDAGRARLS
jgi:hypothetical protein